MSLSAESRFSQYQIDKAEARLVCQMRFIDCFGPFASPATAKRFQDIFDLLEGRLTTLYKRHERLLVEHEKASGSEKERRSG